MAQSAKPISSPVPESLYPTLSFFMLAVGLVVMASFFILRASRLFPWDTCYLPAVTSTSYEATSSRKNRSLAKELTSGAVASVFLGFGSLFLLLASGVYV
nr:transmembrane protein 258-like isoform X1 [Nicotiana tomentosiformis]